MNKRMEDALHDCSRYTRYYWKPKTMLKLLNYGYVEKADEISYKITKLGKDYLKSIKRDGAIIK